MKKLSTLDYIVRIIVAGIVAFAIYGGYVAHITNH